MRGKLASAIGASVVALGLGSSAFGALLVDFKPDPISPNIPELSWSGSALQQAPGSVGNADGTLPSAQQTPGGLFIQTPFQILGIPGSAINTSDPLNPSTSFFDVTLSISGLSASAPANSNPIIPGITILTQPIGDGHFVLTSTNPGPGGQPTVLLAGSIRDIVVVGLDGQRTGSVQSTTVTYESGVIYDALVAAVPGGPYTGTLSLSLLDIADLQGAPLHLTGANLGAFGANLTGQFSAVIPEPASMSLLALGAAGILARRRRA